MVRGWRIVSGSQKALNVAVGVNGLPVLIHRDVGTFQRQRLVTNRTTDLTHDTSIKLAARCCAPWPCDAQ